MRTNIDVFLITYYLPNGERVWWKESLSSEEAFALGRQLAVDGFRPSVRRISAPPSRLLKAARRRRSYRPKVRWR